MKTFIIRYGWVFGYAIFFIVGIYSGISLYHDYFIVYDNEDYNEYVDLVTFKSGKVALLSRINDNILSPKVDKIEEYGGDSLSVFVKNRRYGYLNNKTGKVVIKARKFEKAWNFDEELGLAAVAVKGLIGFINRSGKFVIQPQYVYNPYSSNLQIRFSDGFCVVYNRNDNLGVINLKNQPVLPFIYSSIKEYTKGYKMITNSGTNKVGLVDSMYKIVIKTEYDDIVLTDHGIIIKDNKKNSQYLLSYDYKTIITNSIFDSIDKIYVEQSEMEDESSVIMDSGYSVFSIDGKTGLLDDKSRRIFIEAKWDDIEYCAPGILKATISVPSIKDDEVCDVFYVLINTKGEIIDYKFEL